MKRLFVNILSMSPQNTSDLVILLSVIVWVVLWVLLILDVVVSARGWYHKLVWFALCSVPILGGLIYSAREILRADWLAALAIRRHDSTKRVTV